MERQYIQAQSRVCNKEGFIEIVVQKTNFCSISHCGENQKFSDQSIFCSNCTHRVVTQCVISTTECYEAKN